MLKTLALAGVSFALASAAEAAPPQILALVATAEPTPLSCSGGTCSAEFSAFCMEKFRGTPERGTAYLAGGSTKLALLATDAAGNTREVDGTAFVSIETERLFASVRISLPQSMLDGLHATQIALKVPGGASLVPVDTADDEHPITEGEIVNYTETLRAKADELFDATSTSAVVAEATVRMTNRTQLMDPAARVDAAKLWRDTMGSQPAEDAPESLRTAAHALEVCDRTLGRTGSAQMMTYCLNAIHDARITEGNIRVWNGLDAAY
jgi:hypothetical protein